MKILLGILGALILAAAPASAQTVILQTSSSIEFTASPDHATSFAGTPIVTAYKVVYCQLAAPTNCLPAQDLGKPTPDASSVIRLTNVFGVISKNTEYTAKVFATGPGGDSPQTAASNPFGATGPPAVPAGAPLIKR